jgi:exonuclease VII large subunit
MRSALAAMTGRLHLDLRRELDSRSEALARLFDRRLLRDVSGRVSDARQGVDSLGGELAELIAARTHGAAQGQRWYGELLSRLGGPLSRELARRQHVLPLLRDDVLRAGRHRLEELRMRIGALDNRVRGLDPKAPLAAGFALVWRSGAAGPELVRESRQVAAGERLRVELKESEFGVVREDSEEV